MKTIIISFILITNQPTSMTIQEAKQVANVSIRKLNTLKPFKFRLGRFYRMKDPYRLENDGAKRLAKFNSRVSRTNRINANYVTVLDKIVPDLAGVAYLCQPRTLKRQASMLFVDNKNLVHNGIIAAHETAHQLGFQHVGFLDNTTISIMDEYIWFFRHIKRLSRFVFYDRPSDLKDLNCAVNQPSFTGQPKRNRNLRIVKEFK